jgi:hypothetical protein
MKLSEFRDAIDRHIQQHGDDKVVIRLSEPSVGGMAKSEVKSTFPGFDWDRGYFIIDAEKPLFLHSDQEAIDKLRKTIDGLVWENMNLKRKTKQTP